MKRISNDSRHALLILLCWGGAALAWYTVGHAGIASAYHGTFSIGAVNDLLAGRDAHSLAHYIEYANRLFHTFALRTVGGLLALIFFRFHVWPTLRARGPVPSLPNGIDESCRTHKTHFPLYALLGFCLLAWAARFVQDDAFISFRYAGRLVSGAGLTWNDGYRVEGYTNFLWTMLMALGMKCGAEPVAWSYALGMLCFVGTLLTVWRLSQVLAVGSGIAQLAILLLATNYTFLAYATGGLETQMQCFLCLLAAGLALGERLTPSGPTRLATLSLVTTAALMTRLDSALLLAGPFLFVMFRLLSSNLPVTGKLRGFLSLILPCTILVGGWFVWKLVYYGDLLPNTFYAKTGGASALRRGLTYAWMFVRQYGLLPFLLLALISARALLAAGNARQRILIGTGVLWVGYVILVGGGFMEFRFLVPILPLPAMLCAWLVATRISRPTVRLILVVLWAAASAHHAFAFRGAEGDVESISRLHGRMTFDGVGWPGIGRALHHHFNGRGDDVVIAVTAAGAIPFYSQLTTIDMHGLNDRWVARHGKIVGDRAGHQRRATPAYLQERGVNLLIGHPQVHPPADDAPNDQAVAYFRSLFGAEPLPGSARIVELPVGEAGVLSMLYLQPVERVDTVIREEGLRAYEIAPAGEGWEELRLGVR